MPRVLLITFCYPPSEFIGAVRAAGLTKYLPRFGWDVSVLTPQFDHPPCDADLIETEYRDVLAGWKARFGLDGKRGVHEQLRLPVSLKPRSDLLHTQVLDVARFLLTYPDETKGWIPFAIARIGQMLRRRERVDAIVSTSPPITAHLIASKAKSILQRPWIADFRDLWTQNIANRHPLLQSLQFGLEKRTLNRADGMVTVSAPWSKRLHTRTPSKPVFTITNGFDPDDFAGLPKGLTSQFTITYCGRLYEGRRDPRLLFEVLRDLFDEHILSTTDVRVRFFGPPESWVKVEAQQCRVEQVVEIHGSISRTQALQRETESQILLLLGWSDPRETGQHTGKLFEYFGAARPILAVGGTPGVLTEALNQTHAGVHAISKQQMRDFLISTYQAFRRTGKAPFEGQASVITQYTHSHMARQFADALNFVTHRPVQATNRHTDVPELQPM